MLNRSLLIKGALLLGGGIVVVRAVKKPTKGSTTGEPSPEFEGVPFIPLKEGEVGPQPRKIPPGGWKTQHHDPGTVGVPWEDVVKEEDGIPPGAAATQHRVSWSAAGNTNEIEVHVPPGEYVVTLRARTANIGYVVKLGGKKYGIQQGPPGTAPILEAIATAVDSLVGAVADPLTQAPDPKVAAIGVAVNAVNSIVQGIPNIVKKSRAKIWTLFRAGKWGKKSYRTKINAALGKWYSVDQGDANPYGNRRGYWRFQGNSVGEWPVVATEPPPASPGAKPVPGGPPITQQYPTLHAEELNNGYMRLRLLSPTLGYQGEVRWDLNVFQP